MSSYRKNVVSIVHHDRRIYGVFYMPEEMKKAPPIVIFCHGFNGNYTNFSTENEYLASKGIASFSFDFCGGSVNTKSDLRTTEMTIFTEVDDLCAVIDYIKDLDRIDQNNIFLFGGSQGGLIAALTAEEYMEEVKGVILLFPAFCIPDDWNHRYPTLDSIPAMTEIWEVPLGRGFVEAVHGYDVFSHIGKYNKKVMMFHGIEDEIVPVEYSEKAVGLYQEAELAVFPGEGHGFSEQGNHRVIEMTYEFVKVNSKE
jgi:dipeptidyl aminopeptidase/acylaminoacyl peptidase